MPSLIDAQRQAIPVTAAEISAAVGQRLTPELALQFLGDMILADPGNALPAIQRYCQSKPDLQRVISIDSGFLYDTVVIQYAAVTGAPPAQLPTWFAQGLGVADPILGTPKNRGQTNWPGGGRQDNNIEFVAQEYATAVWGFGTAFNALSVVNKALIIEPIIRGIAPVADRSNAAPRSLAPIEESLHGLQVYEYQSAPNLAIADVSAITLPGAVSFVSPERGHDDWQPLRPEFLVAAGTGLLINMEAMPGILPTIAAAASATIAVRFIFRGYQRGLLPN